MITTEAFNKEDSSVINSKYKAQCEEGRAFLLKQEANRNAKFYSQYNPDIIEIHQRLWVLVPNASKFNWPLFSLKKIKLFSGETLTDLLLANAIVLALEYKASEHENGREVSEIDTILRAEVYYQILVQKKVSLASPFFNNLRRAGDKNLSSCFVYEPDDSLKSIMKHVTYAAEISKAGGGCVPAHTEYLTPYGWKRFDEYAEGDLVGQYRHETKTVEFIKPEAYIKLPCSEFYHLRNANGINQELSEEHRVLYLATTKSTKLSSIVVKELVTKHNNTISGFSGKILSSIDGTNSQGLNYSDNQLRLITAVQADGHLENTKTFYTEFKFKKERKIKRAKQILHALNRPYTETKYPDGVTRLAFYYPEQIKVFPSEFYQLSTAQLAIIAEEVRHWDGVSTYKYTNWSGSNKSDADFVQFAITASGLRASIFVNKAGLYIVHGTQQNKNSLNAQNKINLVPSSDGFKYCFTVETGALILRNNDSVFITGNSGIYLGKIRGKGASIGANQKAASSIMAWVRLFDQVCVSVNQLGQRPGAITVALPIWHIDIEEFLDCQTENGDLRAKAYNIQPQVCIDNDFMNAVLSNKDYALYCPKDIADRGLKSESGTDWKVLVEPIKKVNARKLWATIQERQLTLGRPYIFFTENAQINSPFKKHYGDIKSANLCCVSGDTLLLTKEGYKPIESLVDTEVEVWNGKAWSLSPVFKTSDAQEVYTVLFSNGVEIKATEYHRWNITNYRNKKIIKQTSELKPGDFIPKTEYPYIEGTKELVNAYSHGMFSADGNYSPQGKANLNLYGEKIELIKYLALRKEPSAIEKNVYNTNVDRLRVLLDLENPDKNFIPDCSYTIKSRIKWLEGLFDGDGTVNRQPNGICSLQLSSVNIDFIQELHLQLKTLGINSTLSALTKSTSKNLPGIKEDAVLKPYKRICISSADLIKLKNLGFAPKRLKLNFDTVPTQSKQAFVKVLSVTKTNEIVPTYCLTEPQFNTVIFNGIESRNCESYSYFEAERYIHCCNLISINLAEHTSLEEIAESTALATEMADLSLNISKLDIPEAQKHIQDFRTIGIGLMGLADWLAYNESYYSDLDLIEAAQKAVSQAAYKASVRLASRWGLSDAPYLDNTFWKKLGNPSGARPRNTMLLATAPNTSTSLVTGATASFLPPYQTEFVDESEDSVEVVTKYDPKRYLTNQQIPQEFITDCTARMQQWTDAGISMEYLLPKGASWSANKPFSENKISAWKQGVKAVYYVRSTDAPIEGCSSGACQN